MALRLTKGQRDEIHYLRDCEHYCWRQIESIMGIDHSVLLREYNRNKKRGGSYDPKLAQQKTYLRNHNKKKQCKTIRMCNELENYVLEKLEVGWSPECVAGRREVLDKGKYEIEHSLARNSLPSTSGMSIRRYIHSKFGYWIKDYMKQNDLLKSYKKKVERQKKTGGRIKNRTFIDIRPLAVSNPKTIGHYECDFIVSVKGDKTVLLTLIDKYSRHKIAFLLPSRESHVVFDELKRIIKQYNVLTITFDNDNGFAEHYLLGIPTYFCHTYSSREKGQIEYGNRMYRIFFPKKTELKNLTQNEVNQATIILNEMPMKCLGYKTPNEVEQEIKKNKQKIAYKSDIWGFAVVAVAS